MNSTLLKMNVDILVDVIANYERLRSQKTEGNNAEQAQALRTQILYLLTATRKENT